jgi:UDP-glucose 4-epimerase
MNCLVTGGAGFIGSNLVDKLISKGYYVYVLDDLSTGDFENVNKKAEFVRGKLSDYYFLRDLVKEVDFIFHEAAVTKVAASFDKYAEHVETNINGTINVLRAAENIGVKKIVMASSASVYGDNDKLPIKEDILKNPLNPYAVTKLAAETLALQLCPRWGVDIVVLRYSNVFGPRQQFTPYAAAITNFFNLLIKKDQPVIFGDGTQTRDFTYVDDVVNANLIAIENEIKCDVFNVATQTQTTVNELYENIAELLHSDIKPMFEFARPGEIKHNCLDISKISEYGYQPRDLKTGLKQYKQWLEEDQKVKIEQ